MKHLVNLLCMFFLGGCISLNVGSKEIGKSESVKFKDPPSQFKLITLKNSDSAWKNEGTGSTLSFLSVCRDAADPSLDSLKNITLRGIDKIQIIDESLINYNEREALKTRVKGQLDGVPIDISLLIFKKNDCNYTISLVGIPQRIQKDLSTFDEFLSGFEAP